MEKIKKYVKENPAKIGILVVMIWIIVFAK
jgi:hypothetical protein